VESGFPSRISFGRKSCSRSPSFFGITKNFSSGSSRFPWPVQPNRGAVGNQNGTKSKDNKLRRSLIAENRVISVFPRYHQLFQSRSFGKRPNPLRKYQQRGRWQRFPPRVPCSESAGWQLRVRPRQGGIVRPHVLIMATPQGGERSDAQSLCVGRNSRRSAISLILISRLGVTTSSFISASKSVRRREPPCFPSAPSKLMAWVLVCGLTYSKRSHHAPPFCSIAREHDPALLEETALSRQCIATALESQRRRDQGGSPNPITPRSSYPLPVIMCTTSSGISLKPARR